MPDEVQPNEHRSIIDYDLHGIAGIRLINASSSDLAAITRQIGRLQSTLSRPPDILIEYVDEFPPISNMRFIGLDDVGYSDEAFFILKNGKKSQVIFDQLGKRTEIVTETGGSDVPLLESMINLTAMQKGFLPLHASAVNYLGKGIAATGWSRGGKTGFLLGFMSNSAHYIGDDWIYVDASTHQMVGLPGLIQVRQRYLREFPNLRARVSRPERVRLQLINLLAVVTSMTAGKTVDHGSYVGRSLKKLAKLVEQQNRLDVLPDDLFGSQACMTEGRLETVFLLVNHQSTEFVVEPLDASEAAQRMIISLQEEYAGLKNYYQKFQFAFPHLKNELIEFIVQRQTELLLDVLSGRTIYAVYHPYPVSATALFGSVRPYLHQLG